MQKIGQLDFKKYYQRRIFGNPYLSNSEIVDRLLSLSDDLKVAYEYFQTLISTVSHHDSTVLQQLLSWKLTQLPQPLQKLNEHSNSISMRLSIDFNVILLMG